MDPTKFLRVPGDSKAKSLIPVGRMSRVSVSKQGSSVKKRDGRSSSTNRPSTLKPEQLFGYSRRSRSCTNLRDSGSTPVCRPRTPTLTSGGSTSKYPALNKEWITAQLSRLRSFLMDLNGDVPTLKPLDTKTYVYLMDLLWKQLDERITITEKNKDEVVNYLKLFKFPATIKPSTLKTPTVPHNFSYILTIWAWLLDVIEVVHNPSKILEPPTANPAALSLYKLSISYLTNRFNLFNTPNAQKCRPEEELKNNYADLLQDGKVYDLEKEEESEMSLAEEVATLKESLVSIKLEADVLRKRVQEEEQILHQNKSDREAREKAALEKGTELSEKMEHLQKVLKEKKKVHVKLKNAMKNQPCSQEEWKSMNEKVESLTFSNQLKQTRTDNRKEELSKLDMDLSEKKHQVQCAVDSINAKITSQCHRRPELEKLKIRETGFFQDDMIDIVNQFIQSKRELDEILSQAQQNMKIAVQDIEAKDQQRMLVEAQHVRRKEELQREKQEVTTILEQLQKSNQELFEQHKLKLKELAETLEKVANERPNLQPLQDAQQQCSEKCSKLIQERDELLRRSKEFFANIYNTIVRSIDERTEMIIQISTTVHNAKTTIYNELLQKIEENSKDV